MSYNRFNRVVMTLFLVGPRHAVIELTDDTLIVRLGVGGYGFRATIPRASIVAARPYNGFVGGWGGHGWAGRWLVNGSSKGIVEVTISPAQRASVLGVSVTLRQLRVSLVDRDGFLAALRVPDAAPAGGVAADRTAAG
jgi:hypothetical protein